LLTALSKDQRTKFKEQSTFLFMYRRPRFLEELHAIREEMAREVDYDVDLFSEMVRSGARPAHGPERNIRGFKSRAPSAADVSDISTTRPKRQKKAG
jgi:hypothetical protein